MNADLATIKSFADLGYDTFEQLLDFSDISC